MVRDVVFPVVGEQTLRDLVKEWKATGPTYRVTLRTVIRNSYQGHYRRMVPKLLAALEFRSNNDVFFARRGEMVSNRREDHEISMLALHLIQNCMVYINTLMIQKVLAQPHWQGKLTPRDYAALTPLIWEHVNPYGRFDLDMNARLALL